jgi:hypothetical protein
MTLSKKIQKLEARWAVLRYGKTNMKAGYIPTPGTTATRALVSKEMLDSHGLKLPKGHEKKESYIAWSLGVGGYQEPKAFYYGWTLESAVDKALKHLNNALVWA